MSNAGRAKATDALRHRRTALVALCATLMVSVLWLLGPTAADAGEYVIDNCPAAPGANGDPGSWIVFSAPQGYDGSCAGGDGDFIGPLGGSMSPGQVDGVQIVAPAPITIRNAKLWWFVPHQISGADTFAIAADNTGSVGEGATPDDKTGTPDDFALPSTTTELTLADYCSNDDAGAGCVFGGGENPNLELFGSELTLNDSALPGGSVTGGALVSGAALTGTQSLSYDAQDSSSGVRLVQLRVDGNIVAQNDYRASCPYTDFLACPPSVSDTISWNTASVADGEHSLELLVESAAQNTSVIYDGTIHTQNAASAPSLGALPAPTSAQSQGTAALAPSAGGPNATNADAGASATLRLGVAGTISRPFAQRGLRVSGRLLGSGGSPIGGAGLEVIQQVAGSGGAEVIAHAQTAPDGTFAVDVPAGPSRVIEVAYRGSAAPGGYAAEAKIAETVAAGVRLQVMPRQTSSEGAITLAGSVQGPVPAHGVIVELLVHYRGRWEPFRTPRTDGHGRFRVRYQFEGGLGRFPFRVEVAAGQSGLPYGAGYSNVVNVYTR